MKQYRVTWEIDLNADTPEEAALEAQRTQHDPESLANVFHVKEYINHLSRLAATALHKSLRKGELFGLAQFLD